MNTDIEEAIFPIQSHTFDIKYDIDIDKIEVLVKYIVVYLQQQKYHWKKMSECYIIKCVKKQSKDLSVGEWNQWSLRDFEGLQS